jgi:hypothetical protein
VPGACKVGTPSNDGAVTGTVDLPKPAAVSGVNGKRTKVRTALKTRLDMNQIRPVTSAQTEP